MIKFESLNQYDNVWLTSDSHYGHKNICRGTTRWDNTSRCRDFDTIEGMNEAITEGLKVVGPNDLLIHLGDVAFGGKHNIPIYFGEVDGDIIHHIGNHDHHFVNGNTYSGPIRPSTHAGYYQFKGVKVYCQHYPTAVWHKSHKGALCAFGHCHDSYEGLGKSQDVGVDVAFRLFGEYRPFSWYEFVELADRKELFLPSHHGPNTD